MPEQSSILLLETQNVYMTAMNAAMQVMELVRGIGNDGLPFIRSSGAASSSLLEAWQNRHDGTVYRDKLRAARVDCADTRDRLRVAADLQQMAPVPAAKLARTYDELIGKISTMLKNQQ